MGPKLIEGPVSRMSVCPLASMIPLTDECPKSHAVAIVVWGREMRLGPFRASGAPAAVFDMQHAASAEQNTIISHLRLVLFRLLALIGEVLTHTPPESGFVCTPRCWRWAAPGSLGTVDFLAEPSHPAPHYHWPPLGVSTPTSRVSVLVQWLDGAAYTKNQID